MLLFVCLRGSKSGRGTCELCVALLALDLRPDRPDEAEQLAAELYAQIKGGAEFDALVKEHTDDAHPGIYGMTMKGEGDQKKGVYKRSGMVGAFGDVGWRLDVNQVGVAPYHPRNSPYGWHIIKRLK